MYPHLIEVHDEQYGKPVTINIDYIIRFTDRTIVTPDDDFYRVRESYDELKQLIRDAGCIIQKKDPRLDDKPMEWDDFAGQEDEIFWNSNACDWWKFKEVVELDNGTTWLEFKNSDGIFQSVYPDDLKAKPMYRMKV